MKNEEMCLRVIEYYNSLNSKKSLFQKKEWTSFASIIKEVDESYQVVSFGSGTKCLGRDELSPDGSLVSDCHAEVIARRAFLLYLFDQMEDSLSPSSQSIFLSSKNEKLFQLKENIKFHLFISHPPCGDASIFQSKLDEETRQSSKPSQDIDKETFEGEDEIPSKRRKLNLSLDVVDNDDDCSALNDFKTSRTGAKLPQNIEKTKNVQLIYEEVQDVGQCRVKPGKGNPTLCMSCSDKMAKWFLMGLQGSLLGNFISHPIRLSSIIIGASVSFSSEAMKRALIDRIAHSHLFPSSHPLEISRSRYNLMEFGSNEEKVPSPISIISWISKGGNPEVQIGVNGRKQGVTKKNLGKPSSKLLISRSSFLAKFKSLGILCGFDIKDKISYGEAKKLNRRYFENWENVKNDIFPGWTSKPDHLLKFCNLE